MPRRRQHQRKREANLAVVRQPKPSTPGEVVVRMRLGFSAGTGASTVPVNFRLNDPFSVVTGWSARASDFQTYRIVALMASVQPVDATPTTVSLLNGNKCYVSALITAAGTYNQPSTFLQVLEFPSADIRPFNTSNPLCRRKFHWRTKDINALVFGSTAQAPPVEQVNLVCALNAVPTGSAAWEINGWLDVEFRGLIAV